MEIETNEGAAAQQKIRGVHILTVSIALMVVSLVLCILVAYQTFEVSNHYDRLNELTANASLCEEAAVQAERASDLLTNEVRNFAVTGNTNHVRNYFNEANASKNRDIALENVRNVYPDQEILDTFELAIQNSMDLMNTEEYAMCLLILAQGYRPSDIASDLGAIEVKPEHLSLSPDAKVALATDMLYNEEYRTQKNAIDNGLSEIWQIVSEKTYYKRNEMAQELSSAFSWQRIFITLLIISSILTFLMIMLLVVRPIRIHVKDIEEDKPLEEVGAYEFKYFARTYNEVYEIKLAHEASLQEKAEHDPLTGALNRLAFDERVEELRGSGRPLSLLLIDIDNFKTVNDTYGHAAGDKVLCMLADLLKNRFRNTDTVARIGGDEFAVIAIDITPEYEHIIRSKIEGINERLDHPREGLPPFSISVGCAFSWQGYTDQLFEEADQALYYVKENGRKGLRIFH